MDIFNGGGFTLNVILPPHVVYPQRGPRNRQPPKTPAKGWLPDSEHPNGPDRHDVHIRLTSMMVHQDYRSAPSHASLGGTPYTLPPHKDVGHACLDLCVMASNCNGYTWQYPLHVWTVAPHAWSNLPRTATACSGNTIKPRQVLHA